MSLILALCLLQDAEIDEITRKIDAAPENAQLRVERARKFFSRKRYEESLKDVDEAVRLKPDLADAYLMRGQVLMALGRKDDAFASWDMAVKLDPKLKNAVEDMKRPPKRGNDDEEARRLEEQLRNPDVSDEEKARIRAKLEEMRRRGGPGRERGPERDGPVTREEIEEARKWLQENEPEQARMLEEILASGEPMRSSRMVREALHRKRDLEDMKQRDPEGYARLQKMRELERKSGELAEKIRRGGHGNEELRKQLSEALGQLFDLREEMRAKELAELKRRVEELEKVLQRRKEGRGSIIERRLKELLGEKSDEDW